MKDYVSFEIAKKLKTKGFREECLLSYNDNGGLFSNCIDTYDRPNQELDYSDFLRCYNDGWINTYDAPTISQVIDWLYDKKKIFLTVDIEPNGFFFIVNSNILINDNGEDEFDIYTSICTHPSPKEAYCAGIEYVLERMI